MSSHSRRKGQRGERELGHLIRHLYPEAKRGFQSRAGSDQCDVEGSPYWIEVKRRKRFAVLRHLEQAERDTDGRQPLLALREDRGEWVIIERLKDWAARERRRMRLEDALAAAGGVLAEEVDPGPRESAGSDSGEAEGVK